MTSTKLIVSPLSSVRQRMRRCALIAVVALATSLLAVSAPLHAPSSSATTPPPGESSAVAPEPNPVAQPVAAPTIDSPSAGIFIGSSTTTVSGTRDASSEVQLLSPAGGDPLCIIVPDGSTTWTCDNARLPNAPDVTLRVVATGNADLFDEITVAVLGAPTVTGGPTGQNTSNGLVRGTGYPGATVTASISDGISCTSRADGSGAWTCHLDGLVSSGSRQVTASQISDYSSPSSSNASFGITIDFDLNRPVAPVITTPSRGAQIPVAGATYAGTGESGATVTVFAGPYSVCRAPVTNAAWSCSAGGIGAGSYSLVAVQKDAAGNVSPGSTAFSVAYVQPSTPPPSQSAPPTPNGTATTVPVPSESEPSASATAEAVPPVAVPEPTASAKPAPPIASEFGAGPWNDPTQFTTAVPSSWSSASFPWLQAVLLALGAVLLLAIPSRLLAGTVSRARGGRPLWGTTAIAGRNRARDEFETAPTVQWNRWLLGGAALVAAATLVMLSGPVVSQPAYLRLLLAVVVAVLIVNLAAALVPLLWSSRILHITATITFLPRYLVLVAVAAIGSRVLDIHPALLFGLLGSVTAAAGPTLAQRGQLASVRCVGLVLLAIIGWLGLSALPPIDGFMGAFLAEVLNTIVLTAIGSAVFVLVPLGSTSGRSVLAWSPPVWAGLMVVSLTLLFAVLSPAIDAWQSAGAIPLLWLASVVFAALSAGAWAWQRFVAPAGL
ncbi:hypothetical protein JF66_04840 [Cryobacterium sp. MLB-32]|uniref:hypothetical protein n=1 Tax=Cryobacterium sp. MLB-32 TaxID=1529318 RepID=UPI0004E72ECF|nr:hypothetical protein [Cryobacterium sp. MLB-32]KFF60377.1 hypothetical protein JF66_04840 [Cryobacterium sp. MLB-32]